MKTFYLWTKFVSLEEQRCHKPESLAHATNGKAAFVGLFVFNPGGVLKKSREIQ